MIVTPNWQRRNLLYSRGKEQIEPPRRCQRWSGWRCLDHHCYLIFWRLAVIDLSFFFSVSCIFPPSNSATNSLSQGVLILTFDQYLSPKTISLHHDYDYDYYDYHYFSLALSFWGWYLPSRLSSSLSSWSCSWYCHDIVYAHDNIMFTLMMILFMLMII